MGINEIKVAPKKMSDTSFLGIIALTVTLKLVPLAGVEPTSTASKAVCHPVAQGESWSLPRDSDPVLPAYEAGRIALC